MLVKDKHKETEVGAIPEDWEVTFLGKLGYFKNGINKNKEEFGHGFPFVNLMDVFGKPRLSGDANFGLVNSSESERRLYELKRDDVLFVRSSVKPEGVGLTTLVCEDLPDTVFSGFLIRFRPDGRLAAEYMEHCFLERTFRGRLIASSTVSANTNINQYALKELFLAYPQTKQEQRAIAAALTDVDLLINSLDRLIAKKRDIKLAAMQQLLTGKTRLPGFTSEWQERKFCDLVEFLPTANNPRADLSEHGEFGYIHYGDIHTSSKSILDCEIEELPSIVAAKVSHLPLVKDGDIVVADASEDYDGIGKWREVTNIGNHKIVAGLHTLLLRAKKSDLSDGFKAYLQYTPSLRSSLIRLATGISVFGISKTNLKSLSIRIPNYDEQVAIANVLLGIDAEITVLEKRRNKTHLLKQGMMQELLTGRTRLI